MICGASAVEVGTYNFTNPMGAYEIVKDLDAYLERENLDINEIIGTLILN